MAPHPQKKCIFCGKPANSKEHFWPQWMHELLPRLPDPKHDRTIITYHPKEGRRDDGVKGRSGGLETIKIRAVCKPCNNNWMSDLEDKTKPFLTPIITGEPVALDFEQMAVIARWATLKCILAEHAAPNTAVTPMHDRTAFMEHGVIPDYFRIYLANHNMNNAVGYIRHSSCMARGGPTPDPPLMGTKNNIQTISFVLGSVFVHLNAARVKDYTLESRHLIEPFYSHARIWPFQHHEMVWPRRPLVDRLGMSLIANTWESIQEAAIVHWGDHP